MTETEESSTSAQKERSYEKRDKTRRWLDADPSIPERTSTLLGAFQKLYAADGKPANPSQLLLSCSPGRAEILGNHTDYNEGLTFSTNIQPNLLMLGRPRDDKKVRIASLDQDGRAIEFTANSADELIQQKSNHEDGDAWADYVKGVVWSMQKRGMPIIGFDAVIQSSIPLGAGVSSSAAIELATAQFIAKSTNQDVSPVDLVVLAKDAENNYVGAPCGYLDQATEALADDGILQMSYREADGMPFTHEAIDIDFAAQGYTFIIGYDPESKHTLAEELGGKYGIRQRACRESVPVLQKLLPDEKITALRDVSPENLARVKNDFKDLEGKTALDYVTHVVNENERVDLGKRVLQTTDIETFGELLTESGHSAIELYGLAEGAEELQFVFDTAVDNQVSWNIAGVRNMGGGFNATTLALVRSDAVEEYTSGLNAVYARRFGRPYQFISFVPAPSAGMLDTETVLNKLAA